MLAVEVQQLHCIFCLRPDIGIKVDIIVNGNEHTVYDSLRQIVRIGGEEIYSLTAEDICGKIVVAVIPCGGVPFDRAAVFFLEHLDLDFFGSAVCVGIDVIMSEPLDLLVLKLNITELGHYIAQSVLFFLFQCFGVDRNGNACCCSRRSCLIGCISLFR